MQQVTGAWRLGLFYSLATAFLWGILPLALKALLQHMDAITLSWYRFAAAALLVFAWLRYKQQVPHLNALSRTGWKLLAICTAGLIGNYLFYLWSVDLVSAAGAQVLIQMAPLLLLLGGVLIYKESFSPLQWLGVCAIVLGLLLFFNQRLLNLPDNPNFIPGALLMFVASITWAAFALAQKKLLKNLPSPAIMMLIYIGASITLIPGVSFGAPSALSLLGVALLIFACLNTLLAYGAFAEALAHWEASRVSATLSITPLITLISSETLHYFWPAHIEVEPLNALSYLGALLVVAGSMSCALIKR